MDNFVSLKQKKSALNKDSDGPTMIDVSIVHSRSCVNPQVSWLIAGGLLCIAANTKCGTCFTCSTGILSTS